MTHYDIALIGSGSGNSLPGPELADKTIVQIERGVGPLDIFGGTCLNVGCIPTKMFVHTANLADTPRRAGRFGVIERTESVDWPGIRDRIFGRIDQISLGGEQYRAQHPDNENLTLLRGTARFTGPKRLEVALTGGGTEEITADAFVLAAGSRPVIPPLEGIEDVTVHTSDTVMRMPVLPASMTILGSGVIAVEMTHVFAALGVDVTMVIRRDRVLRAAEEQVSQRLTEVLGERVRLIDHAVAREIRRRDGGLEITGERGPLGERETFSVTSEEVLVATGRRPNSDVLDVAAAGIAVDTAGHVRVDAQQRVLSAADGSVLEGVWALGDLSNPVQLKHVANHELRIVKHNLLHPQELRRSDTMPVPYGVFTSPPVGAVGLTEVQARAVHGEDVRVAVQEYGGIAYGWAMEDTTGFAKIIAHADGRILGAHIIGPEATTLVQQLIQAMSTGQRVQDIAATQYWIHPAMPELLENALLQLL